jgi:hypothetical protein
MTAPVLTLDLAAAGVTAIIWATGFSVDYGWLKVAAVDRNGKPRHQRGVSAEPGVYFLGLPWLSRRGSSFIWGVWHDAKFIADHIGIQRGYMAYRLGMLKPFLSYHHQVTGNATSGVLRMGSEATIPLARGVEFVGTVGASYADDDYMQAYFAVTPAQALASKAGLAAYDVDAGFKDIFVGGTAKFQLSELWTLRVSARYARLIGDAADSPLVENENQWTAGIGVTYRLDLR